MLEEFEQQITGVALTPSRGGVFEVVVDGDLVFSKKATGRHAEHDDILKTIRSLVAQA